MVGLALDFVDTIGYPALVQAEAWMYDLQDIYLKKCAAHGFTPRIMRWNTLRPDDRPLHGTGASQSCFRARPGFPHTTSSIDWRVWRRSSARCGYPRSHDGATVTDGPRRLEELTRQLSRQNGHHGSLMTSRTLIRHGRPSL